MADLCIAKFGGERENLIIAKSVLECFHVKAKARVIHFPKERLGLPMQCYKIRGALEPI